MKRIKCRDTHTTNSHPAFRAVAGLRHEWNRRQHWRLKTVWWCNIPSHLCKLQTRLFLLLKLCKSWDNSVGTQPGYWLDDQGSIVSRSWEFFSSTPCPYRLWDLPSLSNGYGGLFPWG